MNHADDIATRFSEYMGKALPANSTLLTTISWTVAFLVSEIAANRDRLDALEQRHETLVESINERTNK